MDCIFFYMAMMCADSVSFFLTYDFKIEYIVFLYILIK